nr:MAG TPA: hypothetical protein [Caudoviricetes sp.]
MLYAVDVSYLVVEHYLFHFFIVLNLRDRQARQTGVLPGFSPVVLSSLRMFLVLMISPA